MILFANKDERALIVAFRKLMDGADTVPGLTAEVAALRATIAKLDIEKSKREEDIARQERELRHKVGLERARQEQEIALAKREAALAAGEANLTAERKAFAEQLAFNTQRFATMEQTMKEMLSELMKRLPVVTVGKR